MSRVTPDTPSRRSKVRTIALPLVVGLSLGILSISSRCSREPDTVRRPSPRYHFRAQDNEGVIVFVHGVLGDGSSTWTNGDTSAYWPELLKSDPTFAGFDIYVYEYPTPLFRKSFNIDEVAEDMRLHFDADGILAHDEIDFLAHSMGGLVTRSFLQKYRRYAGQVGFAYFFSTPTEGAEIASLARFLSRNPQYGKMAPFKADNYLADEMRGWLAAEFSFPSFCAYEKRATLGIQIVNMRSAAALCSKPLTPILANHIQIVKPADERDPSYLAFANAFRETRGAVSITIPEGWTLENAISGVVEMAGSSGVQFHPEIKGCDDTLLKSPILSGKILGRDTSALLEKLDTRLVDPAIDVQISAKKNEERSSYEITCARPPG